MSNPLTQNSTASPSSVGGSRSVSPRTAIHAATGASISAAPSQKCARLVNRFVSEYPSTNSSTGPLRTSGHGFGGSRRRNSSVEATNPAAVSTVNATTAPTDRVPAGRWRPAVRGFFASRCRSASRLNAIAADRANTMHSRMPTRSCQRNGSSRHARAALKNANGSAKTVWLNRTSSSSLRRATSMGSLYGGRRRAAVPYQPSAPPRDHFFRGTGGGGGRCG